MADMPESELDADAFYDAGDEGCGGPTLKEIGALLDALDAGQAPGGPHAATRWVAPTSRRGRG